MGAGPEAVAGSGNNSSRKQSANIVNDGQNMGPPDANAEQGNIKASSSAVDLKIQETAEAILELKNAAGGNQLQ